MECGVFFCNAPGGASFSRLQIPNPSGSGKDIAEGKSACREMKSEGSRTEGSVSLEFPRRWERTAADHRLLLDFL